MLLLCHVHVLEWLSRNSLFETDAISEVQVTATGMKPTTT